jgi:AcrR family transcriptional regulator
MNMTDTEINLEANKKANKPTKGERTAERLLDVAEQLFAENGFEGATLRDVATAAGIREPGIYNHFASKDALYYAVLARGLQPMADAIDAVLASQFGLQDYAQLPGVMTDLLSQHPYMPALFQQALMGNKNSVAHNMMNDWLDQLFGQGLQAMTASVVGGVLDIHHRRKMAVRMVALFNLCSGYFLSQRVLDRMDVGEVLDPENIEQQKRMLGKIIKLFILE